MKGNHLPLPPGGQFREKQEMHGERKTESNVSPEVGQ